MGRRTNNFKAGLVIPGSHYGAWSRLAYLLHGATNTWSQIFAIDHSANPLIGNAMTGLVVLAAVIVVISYGPSRLSRRPAEEWRYVIEE